MYSTKDRIRYWFNDFYKLGYYHILTVNTLSTVLGFASQLFVVWILTAEEIGQIRIMQSFLSYAFLFGALGFNSSTLKLCSEDRPLGEIVYLYKKSLTYSSLFSICTLIAFFILNYFGLLIQNKSFENPLFIFLLSVIPLVINGIDSSYLQSVREFKKLARIQMISRIISILLIISLTYFFGLYGFISANLTGNICSSLLLLITVKRINRNISPIKVNNPFLLHFKYSSFSFLSNIAYQASLYFDMILLNYLVKDDPKTVGSYGFATIVISFFNLLTASFQQVLIPVFSNVSSNFNEWRKIFKKYRKIYLFGVSLIGLIGILTLPFILKIIFGTKFVKIGLFFSILMVSWFLNSFYSLQSSALFGLGKLRIIFYSSLCLVLIGLPLNFFMISKYEVIGAAIANLSTSFVGIVIYNIAFSSVLKKHV